MTTTWVVDETKDTLIDGPEGIELSRHGKLSGLDTTRPASIRLHDAGADPKVPGRLSRHPTIPFIVLASRRIRVFPNKASMAEVELVYKLPGIPGVTDPAPSSSPLGRLTIENSIQDVPTQFMLDANGNPKQIILKKTFRGHVFDANKVKIPRKGDAYHGGIVVNQPEYVAVPTPEGPLPPGLENERLLKTAEIMCEQSGTVSFPLVSEHITFERIEKKDPKSKGRKYNGKLNRTSVFGDPPHHWMALITGSTEDGGASYTVRYDFMNNPDSFNPTLTYNDPEIGGSIPDSDEAEGSIIKNARIVKDIEFKNLDLRI